jgi:hypothetical protein
VIRKSAQRFAEANQSRVRRRFNLISSRAQAHDMRLRPHSQRPQALCSRLLENYRINSASR